MRLADQLLQTLRQRAPITGLDVVDAHAHLGPYSLFHIPRPGPAAMVEVMDLTGVASATISANRGIQLEADRGNAEVLAAAQDHPGRFLPVGVLNPWQDPDRTAAAIESEPAFCGLKIHPELSRYPIDGPRHDPAFELSARTGMPLLTHTSDESRFSTIARVLRAAERHPEATIILGHAGATPTGVDHAIDVVLAHPRTYLEICGSTMTSALLRTMINTAGAGRVLFGSDFPFIDLRMSLGRVLTADLDDEDLRSVLGATARRIFTRTPYEGAGP
ncbi:amidohydrolase family protein [Propionibacteriaceae bacterium Y1685]